MNERHKISDQKFMHLVHSMNWEWEWRMVFAFLFHTWCLAWCIFWNGNAKIEKVKCSTHSNVWYHVTGLKSNIIAWAPCSMLCGMCKRNNTILKFQIQKLLANEKSYNRKFILQFEFSSKEMRKEWQQTTFLPFSCSMWHNFSQKPLKNVQQCFVFRIILYFLH